MLKTGWEALPTSFCKCFGGFEFRLQGNVIVYDRPCDGQDCDCGKVDGDDWQGGNEDAPLGSFITAAKKRDYGFENTGFVRKDLLLSSLISRVLLLKLKTGGAVWVVFF